ncbi:MAG TPA: type II toxin-antitoxin system VapC family toxin [Pirellulales bacterium]
MKPILIDTNAYAAYRHGNVAAKELIEAAPRVGVSVVVLAELLTGFRLGRYWQKNFDDLQAFLSWPGVEILSIESETARRYSELSVELRRAGTPIPTNDLWIAATALATGFGILTYDAHFRRIPGIIVGTTANDFGESA